VLQQAFAGSSNIQSGVVNFSLSVTPTGGSGLFSQPLSLTVNGPFQMLTPGSPPALDLTATATAFGQSWTVAVICTGHAGYVTLNGTSYALPGQATRAFRQALVHRDRELARHSRAHTSRAHQLARRNRAHTSRAHRHRRQGLKGSGMSGRGLDMLARLGIDPSAWLVSPTVVSTNATAGGVPSTEVQAGVNVATLAQQLYAALTARGGPRAGALPSNIPPAIASELSAIQATVQVYSGNADHTLRKLVINATVPVPSAMQAQLGGVTSVNIVLSLELNELNQPQVITAPTNVQPFKALRAKVSPLLMGVSAMLGGGRLSRLLGN
jgi:hypothetical protein